MKKHDSLFVSSARQIHSNLVGESATRGQRRDSRSATESARVRGSGTVYQNQDVIGNRHNHADDGNRDRGDSRRFKTEHFDARGRPIASITCSVAPRHFNLSLPLVLGSRRIFHPHVFLVHASLDVRDTTRRARRRKSQANLRQADEIDDANKQVSST